MKIFILLLLTIAIGNELALATKVISKTAVAKDQSASKSITRISPPPAVLKASVEFFEKMPPLDPALYPGNLFDRKVATALLKKQSTDIWVKIPMWKAGEWVSTQIINTKYVKYQSAQPIIDSRPHRVSIFKRENKFDFGSQQDKNGDVWQHYSSGYWIDTDHGNNFVYSYRLFSSYGSSDYPDAYTESIDFVVDKATNKIKDVFRKRSSGKLSYVAPGIMKIETVHSAFNENGELSATAWNTELCRRKYMFDKFKMEGRKDFIAYLKNNGLLDLIPIAQSAAGAPASTKTTTTNIAAKH